MPQSVPNATPPTLSPATKPLRLPCLTAGFALLLMAILAGVGNFALLAPLLSPADPAQAAAAIAGAEGQFRLGVACLAAVVVLDVIAAGALFEVFASVNRSVSMVAAWFRVAYSAVFLAMICGLLEVPALGDQGNQVLIAVNAFTSGWKVSLILFAFHLLLIGYLAYRSGFMAKIFGVLLAVAGLGYLVDGFVSILAPEDSLGFSGFAFVGEVTLIFWLLIRGRKARAYQEKESPMIPAS